MLLGFDTEEIDRARAALLIYALFKSRSANSPLNGLECWNRTESFLRGACLKSSNTAEFITKFKEMAQIGAIKPLYLDNEDHIVPMADGSVICAQGVHDYHLKIFEGDNIRKTIEKEYPIITMLVRERIQRERILNEEENNDE